MENRRLHQVFGISLLAIAIPLGAGAKHPPGGTNYVDVPPVQWSPCFQQIGTFECAVYEVPLDYSSASKDFYVNGGQAGIDLALIRIPATDQDNRIGSLFLNPGGPGVSGVGLVLNAGSVLYTDEVHAKFDIVGFDPRGTNQSSALSCFTSFDHLDELAALPPFPQTIEEIFAQLKFNKKFRKSCRKNAEAIIDNMTTADVARDMDILREAVGDDQLTYAGYSYGSFLGVTYANLFPKRVRALIVDGVLDPVQWTTGDRHTRRLPVSTRIRSDEGAGDTLREFFRLCDLAGTPRCVLAGDSADRYFELLEALNAEPVILIFPDGSELLVDDAVLVSNTLSVLYDPSVWALWAEDLLFLETLAIPTASATELNVLGKRQGLSGEEELVPQTIEAFPGVMCSDSNNPKWPFAWAQAAILSERQFGVFGPIWTWVSSVCANWPGSKSSRYAGPFTRHTDNPVLVMGTEFDPATRFEGAVTVADLLPDSQLLTVEGWGHTTLFLSQRATEIASDYLVELSLPSAPSRYRVDFPPFDLSRDEVYGEGAFAAQRSAIQSLSPAEEAALPRESAERNRARVIRSITGGRPTYGRR